MADKNIDTNNLRAIMNAQKIDIDPMVVTMRQAMNNMEEDELRTIEDILRHYIERPIEGELTREKIKAAGIRGVAYDKKGPKVNFENRGGETVFTVTSALLGVVHGNWLIGAGGMTRPLTDEERKFFDEQDRREQMIGKLVMYKSFYPETFGDERLAYLYDIEHEGDTDYYQFCDEFRVWNEPSCGVTLRLATDEEVAAFYLEMCRNAHKQEL